MTSVSAGHIILTPTQPVDLQIVMMVHLMDSVKAAILPGNLHFLTRHSLNLDLDIGFTRYPFLRKLENFKKIMTPKMKLISYHPVNSYKILSCRPMQNTNKLRSK